MVESVLRRSKNVPAATLKLVAQFDRYLLSKGAKVDGLDDWFLFLAQYALDPKCMCDDEEHAKTDNGAKERFNLCYVTSLPSTFFLHKSCCAP